MNYKSRVNEKIYSLQKTSEICKLLMLEDTVVIDTETTGLAKDSEIIELTILDKSGTVLFDSLIKPTKSIDPKAIEIHGITDEMVVNAPTFNDLAETIFRIMNGKNIVAHNVNFDRKRLEFEFSRTPVVGQLNVKSWNCTMFLSLHHKRQKWPKLNELAERLDLDFEGEAHRSATDTEMCRKIFIKYANLGKFETFKRDLFMKLGIIKLPLKS